MGEYLALIVVLAIVVLVILGLILMARGDGSSRQQAIVPVVSSPTTNIGGLYAANIDGSRVIDPDLVAEKGGRLRVRNTRDFQEIDMDCRHISDPVVIADNRQYNTAFVGRPLDSGRSQSIEDARNPGRHEVDKLSPALAERDKANLAAKKAADEAEQLRTKNALLQEELKQAKAAKVAAPAKGEQKKAAPAANGAEQAKK